jgi:hypoxanthine-DNA glycosylase
MTDQAFDSVADARCRVLVLGSFPGVQSLRERRYYANPRNQFWALMTSVVGVDLVALDYDDRLAALIARGVGLWDVVATAQRKGSLDSALRNIEPRNLRILIDGLPELRALAFNGAAACAVGQKQLGADLAIRRICLPSSSPAHTIGVAMKTTAWHKLAEFLD